MRFYLNGVVLVGVVGTSILQTHEERRQELYSPQQPWAWLKRTTPLQDPKWKIDQRLFLVWWLWELLKPFYSVLQQTEMKSKDSPVIICKWKSNHAFNREPTIKTMAEEMWGKPFFLCLQQAMCENFALPSCVRIDWPRPVLSAVYTELYKVLESSLPLFYR